MFSGIDLYLNNKLVTKNSDTYPFRAYIENLFSYGYDVKENQLKAAEFRYEDAAGVLDMTDEAITNRGVPVATSKSVAVQGRLHLDLAMQEDFLPDGIEMNLRLSSSRFCLMVDGCPSKIKIETAIMTVR